MDWPALIAAFGASNVLTGIVAYFTAKAKRRADKEVKRIDQSGQWHIEHLKAEDRTQERLWERVENLESKVGQAYDALAAERRHCNELISKAIARAERECADEMERREERLRADIEKRFRGTHNNLEEPSEPL